VRGDLQALGAKLEDLVSKGPEDWLELWCLELQCTKDMKVRGRGRKSAKLRLQFLCALSLKKCVPLQPCLSSEPAQLTKLHPCAQGRSRRERDRDRDNEMGYGGSSSNGGSSRCGICNVDLSSIGPMEGMVSWGVGVTGDGLGPSALGGGGAGSGNRRFHSSCINLALHRCLPVLLETIQ